MFRVGFVAALGAAVVALASPASATTVVVNQTIDVTKGTSVGGQPGVGKFRNDAFSPVSVDIAEGDTLDWTMKFLPGQSFTVDDLRLISPGLHPGTEAFLPGMTLTQDDPAVLQLLGPNDEVLFDFTTNLGGVGASYLIGLFDEVLPGGPQWTGPITFSGLRTVLHVGHFFGAPTSINFANSDLIIVDGDGDIGLPTYVAAPEPDAWALLIMGFGAMGAVLRRRANRSAANV